MRGNRGVSLIEAPAAVIVLTIALLGGCVVYACGALLGEQPNKVSIVQHAEAEAVDDLEQSGCALPFEPITRSLAVEDATPMQPTEDKGRN
jgi:hypothetical protein